VLRRVTARTDPWLVPAEVLYQEAFERRERRDHLAGPLDNPLFHLLAILRRGDFAGFVAVWRFETFVFVEHLATVAAVRGLGIGGDVIALVVQNAPLTVLETERMEESPLARRRLAWYRRHGFQVNPQPYFQPAYGPGLPEVPMHFLSHPRMLAAGEFEAVVQTLRREVYGVHRG